MEKVRCRFVLERKKRAEPPVAKRPDGEQEAQLIALRMSAPAAGHADWSLRLLARRAVELETVETVRRTLTTTPRSEFNAHRDF